MWINSYHAWANTIVMHYGSLDQFTDARTVRIMLRGANREIESLTHVVDALKAVNDPALDEWTRDLNEVIGARNELLQWLENKGLEP